MTHLPPADFLTNLAQERDSFRLFLKILENEQEALVKGEIDKLTDIAQHKSKKVLELAKLADARNRFLAENGLPPDQNGISIWLTGPGSAKETGQVWEELVAIAKAARQLNETNGAMIELKLQHNQQTLAVLMSAANQATLYGPDGQHLSGSSGRHRDKV